MDIPVLTLMYRFSRYDKLYTKEFVKKYKIFLAETDKSKIVKPIICSEINCEKCGTKSNTLLIQKTNSVFCCECLKLMISKIFDARVSFFNKENFINRECKFNQY